MAGCRRGDGGALRGARRHRRAPRAVEWYARLFGRPPDIVAHDREVLWRVAEAGWLAVAEDAGRAGRGPVTVALSDLDEAVADLAARGVVCGQVEAVGDAGRKAIATDPDGNAVALVQVTPA